MKATKPSGELNFIDDCFITIPGAGMIKFNILPDISDTKSAEYNDENILGRSFPLKTFSHGSSRQISIQIHFIVDTKDSIDRNLEYMRWIESAVYTRQSSIGAPFVPPPVCEIRCGDILSTFDTGPLCAVLKSYTVKFPTEVAWDYDRVGTSTLCPYKFDIDTNWDVVYKTDELPGQERIMNTGR